MDEKQYEEWHKKCKKIFQKAYYEMYKAFEEEWNKLKEKELNK
jgi:hypothetical protein